MLSTGYYTQALRATLPSAHIPHLVGAHGCPWLLQSGPELSLFLLALPCQPHMCYSQRNQREGPCQLVECILCMETRHVSAKELEALAHGFLHLTVWLSEEMYKKQQLVG